MVGRMITGAVLSTVWLMAWGSLFWIVLLPEDTAIRTMAQPEGFTEALRGHLPAAGTYVLPSGHEGGDTAASSGEVVAMVHFAPVGSEMGDPMTYVFGAVHFLAASFLLMFLMIPVLSALESYARRVWFLSLVIAFGIVAMEWSDPVWFRLPWTYFLYVSGFLAVGWFGAALIIAAFVRPTRGYTHVTNPDQPLWKRALDVD